MALVEMYIVTAIQLNAEAIRGMSHKKSDTHTNATSDSCSSSSSGDGVMKHVRRMLFSPQKQFFS